MNSINPVPSGESTSHRNVYQIVTEQIMGCEMVAMRSQLTFCREERTNPKAG